MSTTILPDSGTKLDRPRHLLAFEDKLFHEGTNRSSSDEFFALLLFATRHRHIRCALCSTATVIGAMIVAPLMDRFMATTAAVVMGSSQRALRAFGLP